MFANLIDNAYRYNEPGGLVDISIRSSPDTAEIRIGNTGHSSHPSTPTESWNHSNGWPEVAPTVPTDQHD